MKPVCEMPFLFEILLWSTRNQTLVFRSHWKSTFQLRMNLAELRRSSFCAPCSSRQVSTDRLGYNWWHAIWSAWLLKCLWPFPRLRKTPSGNFSQIWRSTSTAFYYDLIGSARLIMSIMFAFLRAWLTITLASVFVMFSFKPLYPAF